jgi:hypothetical protein
MPSPLANGALCLSTPKHNGKSGTVYTHTVTLVMDRKYCLVVFIVYKSFCILQKERGAPKDTISTHTCGQYDQKFIKINTL